MKLSLSLATLLVIATASAAAACPSGTCPTGTTSQPGAKPSGGQAAQPYVPSVAPVEADVVAPVEPPPTVSTSGAYLERQAFDCSDFQRANDGGWTALRAVSFPAPEGPMKIDSGSVYRPGQYAGGYDLGSMLEHDCR